MPPVRSHDRSQQWPPGWQTPSPIIITAHYLRQIEANHVRTPTQGQPIPLEFNGLTQSLSEWPWPCHPDTERRIPPSDLESFRRTHRFKAPSCLCPLLEGGKYKESRIGIVETVTSDGFRNQSVLNGEYVATCAKQRCGYFLCLERFYPLNNLRLRVCQPRKRPLAPQEVASICDIDKSLRRGDGLFQLMTDVVVRGIGGRLEQLHPEAKEQTDAIVSQLNEGMPEDRFWTIFVQCFICKVVTFRKNFAVAHACKSRDRRGRAHTRSLRTPDATDSQRYDSEMPSSPSPAPTEPMGLDVFADVGDVFVAEAGSSDAGAEAQTFPRDAEESGSGDILNDSDGIPLDLDDDFELPPLSEILGNARRRPLSEVGNVA